MKRVKVTDRRSGKQVFLMLEAIDMIVMPDPDCTDVGPWNGAIFMRGNHYVSIDRNDAERVLHALERA